MRLKGIEVEKSSEDVTLEHVDGDGAGGGGDVDGGVGSPYYPVFLPMDQDFKAKYMWHHRNLAKRGKSIQELNFMNLQDHSTAYHRFKLESPIQILLEGLTYKIGSSN